MSTTYRKQFLEHPLCMRYNLPHSYVAENAELYETLFGPEMHAFNVYALFRRAYGSSFIFVPVNSGASDSNKEGTSNVGAFYHTSRLRFDGREYLPFSHWEVILTHQCRAEVQVRGTGSTPLTALREALFQYGLRSVFEHDCGEVFA